MAKETKNGDHEASRSTVSSEKRRRRLSWQIAILGGLGAALLAAAFGYFVFPLIDTDKKLLPDRDAAALVFGWLGLVVGFFGGFQVGGLVFRRRRRRDYQVSRRARYADQLAAFEREKEELASVPDPYEERRRMPQTPGKKGEVESPWP